MNAEELPLVTVLIPARNEEADIGACLDAVLAQDHPHDCLEVIVVDGGSTDGTADRARARLGGSDVQWQVVDGPGPTPANLNVGLARASGSILCRVDARSLIRPDHVRRCADVLLARAEVVLVGGSQVPTSPSDENLVGRGITRALRNPWATGLARYRRSADSGRTDTVYLGAFRVEQLRLVGGWDERFATNQDFELNRRLGARGVVWFESGLDTGYRPRAGLRSLWSQHRRFGRWKAAGWLEAGVRISGRQVVLLVGPPALGVCLVVVARRSVVGAAAVAVGSLVAVERRAGAAAVVERLVAAVAVTAIAGGWWCGVVEQTLRCIAGQRLLAGGARP